ncbi:hypothetical protein ACK325_04110 [Aeromonas hydrophila]|uniref:hypothetical protein n=1 Tax=Aeromonas hydrophila TaxID=644 RepID=UPI0009B8506C|nr:hypothetical protein [Aeromonas hydrophila]
MDELKKTIHLRCTFCRSGQFALPYENYTPPSHSFVVCANCGRENDVTSLLIVAKTKAFDIAQNYVDEIVKELESNLTKSFKKLR